MAAMSPISVDTTRVTAIKPHPDAQWVEIARVVVPRTTGRRAFANVVVRTGDFSAGDLVIYVPPGSVVPGWLDEWLFPPGSRIRLHDRRVRRIKIRGVYSDGLVIKPDGDLVALVRRSAPEMAKRLTALHTARGGQPWADILGVTRYETPRPFCTEHPHLSREEDMKLHQARFEERRRSVGNAHRGPASSEGEAVSRRKPVTPLVRYVRVLGGVLVLLATALVFGNAPLLALGVFALALATLGLPLQAPSTPVVERTIGKVSYWVDETITVDWTIEVAGGAGPVLVYDELPDEMELVSGNNIRLFWKGPGETELTHRYSFRCPRRGFYWFTSTRWEIRHPLGFSKPVQGKADGELEITVFPRVLATRRLRTARGLAVTPLPMAALARMGIQTTDFREIRQYTPGDPMRNVNWKATARRVSDGVSVPLVNQYEFEGKRAVWLFFDSSEYMGVGTSIRSPLEQAIEAASGLGYYYLNSGYHLGAHFSNRPDQMLPADTGRRQFLRLTQQLLKLEPQGPRYDLLAAIRVCQSQLLSYSPRCIILTRLDTADGSGYATQTAADLLAAVRRLLGFSLSRRSRISVWVVGLTGYSYAASARTTPGVASTIRALETRPLLRELRRTGASILDWDPLRESFAQVLLRQLRRESGRR